MENFIAHYAYYFCAALFCLGLFQVIISSNRIKKLYGLSIMQSGVMLFFIATGFVRNSQAPIINDPAVSYSNPLPHVLILTAIVVGLSVTAVGLALAMRISRKELKGGHNA